MKKIITMILLSTIAFATTQICVSILPQKTFVKKITKDLADVYVMVPKGSSPHSYEPKPSQMQNISNAKVYFGIEVEFEKAWLDRFMSQNKNLKFVNVGDGIQKIAMPTHHHEEEKGDNHKDHEDEDGLDPHLWTSPSNVKIIAKNIYETMIAIDSTNKDTYKKNYEEFLNEISVLDKQIQDILSTSKNKKFLVFHPSFGYYAKDYNLTQMSIEVSGKEPKMKELMALIKEAKENDIKTVFTNPEFSDKSANVIAKDLNATVIKISPLEENWEANLIKMTKAIAN